MNILFIDNELLAAIGLQKVIEDNFDSTTFTVQAKLNDVKELINQYDYDVIFLDIGLQSFDVEQFFNHLDSLEKNLKILIFSREDHEKYALKYISLGASGFLPKTASPESLLTAIELVKSGQVYLSQKILSSNINSNGFNGTEPSALPVHTLSKREKEAFQYLIDGVRVKEICATMGIHQSTASTLKKRILKKLNVENMMDLKTLVLQHGY